MTEVWYKYKRHEIWIKQSCLKYNNNHWYHITLRYDPNELSDLNKTVTSPKSEHLVDLKSLILKVISIMSDFLWCDIKKAFAKGKSCPLSMDGWD